MRKAVDQRFTLVDNDAFETVSPKIATTVMAPIVLPGKVDLNLPHKFRKNGSIRDMSNKFATKVPTLQTRFTLN